MNTSIGLLHVGADADRPQVLDRRRDRRPHAVAPSQNADSLGATITVEELRRAELARAREQQFAEAGSCRTPAARYRVRRGCRAPVRAGRRGRARWRCGSPRRSRSIAARAARAGGSANRASSSSPPVRGCVWCDRDDAPGRSREICAPAASSPGSARRWHPTAAFASSRFQRSIRIGCAPAPSTRPPDRGCVRVRDEAHDVRPRVGASACSVTADVVET